MGLMNYQQAQPFTPPESLALAAGIVAASWYPLHEGAGTSCADALGSGPALTLGGTTGGSEWGTWGAISPNGSDNRLISPAGNAHLNSIMSWTALSGQQLLIGFELATDGAGGAQETLIGWGRNSSVGEGGWWIELSATMQWTLNVRGKGGASNVGYSIAGTAQANGSTILHVLDIRGIGAAEGIAYVRQWRVGTGLQSGGVVSSLDLDGNGTAPPGNDPTNGLALFARGNSTTFERFCGATAGSNAKLNNLWMVRRSSIDDGLPDACLLDMVARRREFPTSLRAR